MARLGTGKARKMKAHGNRQVTAMVGNETGQGQGRLQTAQGSGCQEEEEQVQEA